VSAPRVRVRIRRLVLDGVDPAAGDRLAAGIERELARLLERQGAPALRRAGASTASVAVDLIAPDPDSLGARLAEALATIVHQRIEERA
jgi:hypothetical protein